MEATLIKVDRNGSKHYEGMHTCDRCGGTGTMPFYAWNGVCLKCNGAGKVFEKWIERTPEYEQKLADQRAAKWEARIAKERPENRARSLKALGFNENEKLYVFMGNTYECKDALKELGAKFRNVNNIGWYIDHEVEGYDIVEFTAEQLTTENGFGSLDWNEDAYAIITEAKNAYNEAHKPVDTSEYVGEIGGKFVDMLLTYVRTVSWDSQFGIQNLHQFKDENGNVLVWKTTNSLGNWDKDGNWNGVEEGASVKMNGSIKDHSDYRGIKQTVITRCKVVA